MHHSAHRIYFLTSARNHVTEFVLLALIAGGPATPDAVVSLDFTSRSVDVLKQGTTLGFQRRNLLTQKLVMRLHPQHTSTQTTRERRAIPQPQRLQLFGQFAQAR